MEENQPNQTTFQEINPEPDQQRDPQSSNKRKKYAIGLFLSLLANLILIIICFYNNAKPDQMLVDNINKANNSELKAELEKTEQSSSNSSFEEGSSPTLAPTVANNEESLNIFVSQVPSNVPSPTPAIILDKYYQDKYYGYSLSYNDEWHFRETYGPDVENYSGTLLVSGCDLHLNKNQTTFANVGINVHDARGLSDIDQWIKQHDPNEPDGEKKKTIFLGVSANRYDYVNTIEMQNGALFFIKGDYAYKIWWWGKGEQYFNQAWQIVNTFST